LTNASERVNYLVKLLSQARTIVLIPTPVLTEVLCKAGAAGPQYVQLLQRSPFLITPFDTRAAIECAAGLAHHINLKGSGRDSSLKKHVPGTRAKVKFDQQVVAIAQANGVGTLYSDDEDVHKEGRRVGIKVVRSYELPRDPETAQSKLFTPEELPAEKVRGPSGKTPRGRQRRGS
jgi:hypothetical protein